MAAEEFSVAFPRSRPLIADRALLWLIPAALYYSFLLTAGSSGLFAPVNHGLTFNSMLLHMLHGRFDVDPWTIGDEGYLRDGAVYAYFGIFPALFRALFLWLPNFASTDMTRIACLTAVTVMAGAKVMSARLVWRHAGAKASSLLLAAMIAALLLGGAQIEFLRPSIFQEPELWAGALSAVFVYLALRGFCAEDGFSPRLLGGMAVIAGLCLLTRVSNAVGLYVAFGLIWLCVAYRAMDERSEFNKLIAPLAISAVFVASAAFVNFARWGNPLVFVDVSRALINVNYPERMASFSRYGAFNLARIPLGLSYYFAPVWFLRDAAGNFFGSGFEDGFVGGSCELPPSSFFLSDPLLIGLCVYGAATALRKDAPRRVLAAAAGIGLLIPIVLMLTAFSMSYRYRMEFFPFFELFAFFGFARLAAKPAGAASRLAQAGALYSILAAHAIWVLYMLSPFGPAANIMGSHGIVDFYTSLFN